MTRRGWVLFWLLAVIWGLPYLMIKVAVAEVSVPVLVFARTALAAAVLLPLSIRSGHWRLLRRHWLPLAGFAAAEIIVPWWLLSDAERSLPSSTTGLLIAVVPILSALTVSLTGDAERLGPKRWIGLAVGFAGVAVLAWPELGGGDAWSVAEVLLTAVCYAVAPVLVARRLQEVPALLMSSACLAFAALLYAPAAIMTWPATAPSTDALLSIAGLGVLCTAIGFIVFFALIREAGPSRAMVFAYFNPVVALAAGVLVLSEPITTTTVVAFALILAGSLLATARTPSATPGPAVTAAEPADARLPG